MINSENYLPTVDKIAVSASILCGVHCLFLPLLVVVSPTIAATIFGQESRLLRLRVPIYSSPNLHSIPSLLSILPSFDSLLTL